ncbi:aminotransferase class V-fold PLP-dependent enzyme [Planctomicrobium piriforme]|uniref:Cysteine desulfurase n=1 Tax=Planctomicrobium piriforme TaxID=1576369 RepID=A0A1I3MRZ7_9PLAN|nr:cysteine desulfurase [Planctomicrobium piriforme]SFI99788.1 cysteine desulfurase / selenocysteine lyase [Planctomicrobium piriforme]
MFDPVQVRSQFPIFQQTLPKGLPVTFLDSAASAQKPQTVIDAERRVYETHYANAYRGVYRFGAQIDDELEASRDAVRMLLGAERVEEVIFTAGTTLALNMVAFGWGRKHLKAGDEILLNLMEHHANLVPWQQVAKQTGANIRYLPLTPQGELDLTRLDEFLNPRTKIVSVTAMSNVLGTLNPIRKLADRAHDMGAVLVVDAAQSVPHGIVDVVQQGIDFLAFSGHKLYGPTGVGVLYGRRDLLNRMDPIIFGGHMIEQVHLHESSWAHLPAKFEAGTIPIVQAIALKTAIDFVDGLGFDAIHAHEQDLVNYAWQELHQIPGLKVYGPPPDRRGAILSFSIARAHPEDLAQLLDRKGVFVRHGHHCTMPLHAWLEVPATVRASFGVYNTREDVDRLRDALLFAREKLRLKAV